MLSEIEIKKISEDNFNRCSLLSFNRHQEVKECWRKRGGEWILLPISFVDEWNKSELETLQRVFWRESREERLDMELLIKEKSSALQ